MNERIRELYVQAAYVETPDGLFPREAFDHEKFAELIIRECLNVVNKKHKLALEFDWDNDDTATSIKDSIKQHFGVEE